MKFTKIPETTFETLQLNAGVLANDFDPTTGTLEESALVGATTGGISFTATPEYSDFADDIDNAPKNMMEFKRLNSWGTITLTGTFVALSTATAKMLVAAADAAETQIIPRNNLDPSDFADLWWIGDYSDKNGEDNGGFVAIHMMNALSTGGFSLQTADRAKGTFSFTFTAHYSIAEQDTVPFEIYIKAGTEETA